jgi:hypothetical protein
MNALLEALAHLPAGASTLSPAQVTWLAGELESAGLRPAQDGVWRVWTVALEGACDERASARLTLHERGLSGSALVQRGAHHVDESDEQMMVAPPERALRSNGGRAIAMELIARAQQIKQVRR